MDRITMYNVARMGYVPGNVKFLDVNGKFHNFGSACGRDGVFQFNENREEETPMPRHHLCSMLELEEEDDPHCGEYSVMIKTYGIHGKTTIREITGFYMDGTDLIFTESPTMKKFSQAGEERVITLKLNLDEFRWLKNRVMEKLEFYSKCKHINYVVDKALGKSVQAKMEKAEWGEVFGD